MRLFLLFFIFWGAQNSFGQLIPIQKDGKWGYCNEQLEITIPCKYDAAYPFADNRALVEVFNYENDKNEHRACFIDHQGKAIFCWDVFSQGFPASRFQDGVALIENYQRTTYKEEPKLSIVDTMGVVLQEIKGTGLSFKLSLYYTYSAPFNASGIYSSSWYSKDSSGIVLIYKNLDAPKYLPYGFVSQFKDGFAIASIGHEMSDDPHPTALINTKGEEVIPPHKFRMISNYDFHTYGSDQLILVEKNRKYGYINTSGELVIPYQFDNAKTFSNGMAAVGKIVDETKYGSPIYHWGYINKKGELMIDYKYKTFFNFSEDMVEVMMKDELQFLDKKGKVLLRFKQKLKETDPLDPYPYGSYVYQHEFHNGRAILFQNDQIGWINKKGEFIIPPFYTGLGRIGPFMIVYDFEKDLSRVMHPDGDEIYINTQGKQYYLPSPKILAKTKSRKAAYSSIAPIEFADSIHHYGDASLISKLKKGQWLKIKHYKSDCQYVRAEDYYHQILYCNQIAQLYKSPKDPKPKIELQTNSRLYLAEGEKNRRVQRRNKWLKVIYYGPLKNSYDYQSQSFYIKSDQVDILKF